MFGSAAPGTGTNILPPGVTDPDWPTEGTNQVRVKPYASKLLGLFYTAESTPSYARLREVGRTRDLEFIKSGDLNTLDPFLAFNNYLSNPIQLIPDNLLSAYTINATDEDTGIVALLGNGPFPFPNASSSPIETIRGTLDKTLTPLAWSVGNVISWDYDLEAGDWYIVGCKVAHYLAANMTACYRLDMHRQGVPKYGGICEGMGADKTLFTTVPQSPINRWAKLEGLKFNSKTMPTIDLCGIGATTDFLIQLDVAK